MYGAICGICSQRQVLWVAVASCSATHGRPGLETPTATSAGDRSAACCEIAPVAERIGRII
jgi:hypothetical protein